jgi:hypothetical protein
MIRLYFHQTPNPAKIALFLEEAGLPYEAGRFGSDALVLFWGGGSARLRF